MKLRICEGVKPDFNFDYLLDMYEYPDYDKYKNADDVFYHNTYMENVKGITQHGLLCDKAKSDLTPSGIAPITWCVNTPGSKGYGGCTVAFKYDLNKYTGEQVNTNEFTMFNDVPAKDILFIDTWVCTAGSSGRYRLSDMKSLLSRFGEDKVRQVFQRYIDTGHFYYTLDKLIEYCQK